MIHKLISVIGALLVVMSVFTGCDAMLALGGKTDFGSGPVYMNTRSVVYFDDGTAIVDTEFDEHGNKLKTTVSGTSKSANAKETRYSDFTPEGYPRKITRSATGETVECSYEIEDGHAVSSSIDGGAEVTSYSYYENGALESETTTADGSSQTIEYDENGYVLKYETDQIAAEYIWSFDDDGKATGYSMTVSRNLYCTTIESEVECDEEGNIVRFYHKDGSISAEYEYVRIDNPSANARIRAHVKPF